MSKYTQEQIDEVLGKPTGGTHRAPPKISQADRDFITGEKPEQGFGERFLNRFGERAQEALEEHAAIVRNLNDPAGDLNEGAVFAEVERRLNAKAIRRGHDEARRYRGLPAAEPAPFRSGTEMYNEMKSLRAKGVEPTEDPEFLARSAATPAHVKRV